MKKFTPDPGKTALANACDLLELFRAENPQTTYHDPHCGDEDPEWRPLKHEWTTGPDGQHCWLDTLGPIQAKPCSHALSFHVRGGAHISDTHPISGRRDNRGAFRLGRWKNPSKATLPARTLENIAACAAVGLSFWCESSFSTSVLIAVDDEQVAHRVRIDRKQQRSEHQCHYTERYILEDRVKATYRPDTKNKRACERSVDGIVDWAKPPTMNALWDMLGPLTRDQAIDEYHEQIARMDGPAPTTEEENHGAQTEEDTRGADSVSAPPAGAVAKADRQPGGVERVREADRHRGGSGVKSLENGPGNPYNQPMPGTPEKAAAVKASEKAREKKLRPGQGARLTAAEAREWKAAREARQAVRDAEYARRDAEIEAEVRAKFAKQDAEEAAALQRAAGEKTMSREVARSLLLHDPDYLGDITNAALVDLLDDESVAAYHGRIRAELTTERGLTEKVS